MSVQPQDLISHILHTAKNIERMCDNEARQTGLTGSQARLLCFLSIASLRQDIFQKDIEEAFGIRPSSATGLLQALEQQGFIRREPVSLDGRLKKIVFTEKAQEIQSRVIATHKKALERLQGPLTNREVADFMKLCSGFAERAAGI